MSKRVLVVTVLLRVVVTVFGVDDKLVEVIDEALGDFDGVGSALFQARQEPPAIIE